MMDEVAGVDINGVENDGLEIGGLVSAVPAAAVPQPRLYEFFVNSDCSTAELWQ